MLRAKRYQLSAGTKLSWQPKEEVGVKNVDFEVLIDCYNRTLLLKAKVDYQVEHSQNTQKNNNVYQCYGSGRRLVVVELNNTGPTIGPFSRFYQKHKNAFFSKLSFVSCTLKVYITKAF